MSAESEQQGANSSRSSNEIKKPPLEPIRLRTIEEVRGQDIWNNCAVRSIVSGVMGGGLGLFMGLFLGALDNPLMQEEMTGRQQFIYTAKQMGSRSWSSCKTFAVMGLIFSAAECVVEKFPVPDQSNTFCVLFVYLVLLASRPGRNMTRQIQLFAGCVTGGALSAKGGPTAACIGCAGFAAFSVAIEKFLESHD